MIICALFALAMLFTACASVRTHQEEAPDGTRITDFTAKTFFDSKNELAKARTTMTDKSQGVSLSGLDQESSGSNAASIMRDIAGAVAEGAVRGAAKSVKP